MKKIFVCCMLVFMSFVLSSCKLTISSSEAPSTANTGEVIILTVSGYGTDILDITNEYGIILQIPANWEVVSASATATPSVGWRGYTLTEKSQYEALYTAQPGYKIWVGTDTETGRSDSSSTVTVKILTGKTPAGQVGTTQNYNIKFAVGAFRNSAWVTDDPVGIYNFSNITDSKYVKNISVINNTDSVSPASVSKITAEQKGNSSARISWSGYDEASQKDIVTYRIYKNTANFTNVSGMTYTEIFGLPTYYDISGLTPSATYYFAVTAVDEAGNENKTVTTQSLQLSLSYTACPSGQYCSSSYQDLNNPNLCQSGKCQAYFTCSSGQYCPSGSQNPTNPNQCQYSCSNYVDCSAGQCSSEYQNPANPKQCQSGKCYVTCPSGQYCPSSNKNPANPDQCQAGSCKAYIDCSVGQCQSLYQNPLNPNQCMDGRCYVACSSGQYCPSGYQDMANPTQCQIGKCQAYITCPNGQCPTEYQNPLNPNECQSRQCYAACPSGQYCPSGYKNPKNSNECQSGKCQAYITCPSGAQCSSEYQNPTNPSQCQSGQCYVTCSADQYCPSSYKNPTNPNQCLPGYCQAYITCPSGSQCSSEYQNPTNPNQCQSGRCYVSCSSGQYCLSGFQNPTNPNQCQSGWCLNYIDCSNGQCSSEYKNPTNPNQCQSGRCYVSCSSGQYCLSGFQNPTNPNQCQSGWCLNYIDCSNGQCSSEYKNPANPNQCQSGKCYVTCASGQYCPSSFQNPTNPSQCQIGWCSSTTYTYTSLHGADLGSTVTGNFYVKYYSFSSKYRVLIPPGTKYFNMLMICDNLAAVSSVARFGQAPSGYTPLPSDSTVKTLDQARIANIVSSNQDGYVDVARQSFSQPLAENLAGWFFVDIVGSGVRSVDLQIVVDTTIYTEWYNRKKGSIDCPCAAAGQCAMCGSEILYVSCLNSSGQYCPSPYKNPTNPNECQFGQCQSYVTCSSGQSCPSEYQNPTNPNQCQPGQCQYSYVACPDGQYCPIQYQNPANSAQCQSGQCQPYSNCSSDQYCPSQYQNPSNTAQCQSGQCQYYSYCSGGQFCPSQYQRPGYTNACQQEKCQSYTTCSVGQYCPSQYQNPTNPNQCQSGQQCQPYISCSAEQYCPAQYRNPTNPNQCQSGQCQSYTTCSSGQYCPVQYKNPTNPNQCQSGQCQPYINCSYYGQYCPSQYQNTTDPNQCMQGQCQSYTACSAGQYCPSQYQRAGYPNQCQSGQCQPYSTCSTGKYCPSQYQNPASPNQCQIGQCQSYSDTPCSAEQYCPTQYQNPSNPSQCQKGQCQPYITCSSSWWWWWTPQYCPSQYQRAGYPNQCQSGQCQPYITCPVGKYCTPQYQNPDNRNQCQSLAQCQSYTTCSSSQYCPSQYQNPANPNQCYIGQCQSYGTCSVGQYCPSQYQNPTTPSQCQTGQCQPYIACSSGQYCLAQYQNPNNSAQCQSSKCQPYVACSSDQYCPSLYQNPNNSAQCQSGQCQSYATCSTTQYCPSQYQNPNNPNQCMPGQCQPYITCSGGQYCPSLYQNPVNTTQCQSGQCQPYSTCSSEQYCPSLYQNPSNKNQCQTGQCQPYSTCSSEQYCPSQYQNPSNPSQCYSGQCQDSLIAKFAADKNSGVAPLTVNFFDRSAANPTSWKWDFNNDGIIDKTEQNPSFTYTAAGKYSVRLTVVKTVASDDEIKTDYVEVIAPKVNFIADQTIGTAPFTVRFFDQSVGNFTSWKWDFDNNGTIDSTEKNPVWIYTQPGTYTVSLTVNDGTKETKAAFITADAVKTTSYYGEVLSVSPQTSDGTQNIQISGRAIDRLSKQPMPNVPMNVIVSLKGFERTLKAFTDTAGNFHTTFFQKNEFGYYDVRAVHPESTDKTAQAHFTISGIIVSPATINLDIPISYEQKIDSISVTVGGLELHNVQLVYEAADQDGGVLPQGVHVTLGSPVPLLSSGQSAKMECTIWADNMADRNGRIVLKVRSDEKSLGTVVVNTIFSEAKPALFYTPSYINTGLALGDTITETVTLENKGLAPLNDVSLSLIKQDGTPAPAWVSLSSPASQGMMAVGDKRDISIFFAPTATDVSQGWYSYFLLVKSSNSSDVRIQLAVSITLSGKGNVLFKVSDIYTGYPDPTTGIAQEGLAGAYIKLQNEKVLTQEFTKTTDSKGQALLNDLPAGVYKYRASSDNHQEVIGRIWIKPGITATEEVFLINTLVTVEWEVRETTIQDKYDIVLKATYETKVPAPVVVAEPASLSLPDMNAGDVLTGEVKYINYGLIRAENVNINFPQSDEYFKYEILADNLPKTIEAKEFITIPYRVTCLKSLNGNTITRSKRDSGCYSYFGDICIGFDSVCINGVVVHFSGICHYITAAYGLWCGGGSGGGGGITIGTRKCVGTECDKKCSGNCSNPPPISPPGDSIGEGGGGCRPPDDPPKCPRNKPCCEKDKSEPKNSKIELIKGEYRDDAVDLSVKVPGHVMEVKRYYYDNAWHFGDLIETLEFVYGADGSIPKSIKKHGVNYKKTDDTGTVYTFDENGNIFKETDGYRWKDSSGNWSLYDLKGRILSYGNRNNQKVSFVYEPGDNGRLVGIADNSGKQVLSYEYIGNDISTVKDANGRKVSYAYENGKLSEVTDILGYEWTYHYDANGRLDSKQDPEGHIATITYNDSGHVAKVTDSDGISKSFDYNYDSSKLEYYARVTYSTGKTRELWYNEKGDKLREDINGKTVQKIVYENGNETEIDANGNETYREYDEKHNLKKETFPDASSVSYEYETKFNQKIRVTDQRGVVTKYEYDDAGNRTKKVEAYNTPNQRTSEYSYYPDGSLQTEKIVGDAATPESVTTMEYDDNGNLISVTDPEGNKTNYTYNVMGKILTKTDPRGKVWTYNYDDMGNLKSVTDPLNNVTRYEYDKVGNKIKETDPSGKVTQYEYDYNRNLKKITDAYGNITQFIYTDGKPTKRIDPEGKELKQEYDNDGNLWKTIDGNGNTITYEYQNTPGTSCQTCSGGAGSDAPTRMIYPTNFAKEIQYDKLGRKEIEKDVSGTDQYLTKFGYDPSGNLILQTDKENHTTNYDYDELGRKIRVTDAINGVTEYTYDDRNNLIALKDANGNVTHFEYDRNNRLKKETRPMGQATAYDYDSAGNLIRKTDAKAQKTDYEYDDTGRMKIIRYYGASDSMSQKTVNFDYYPKGMLKSYSDGKTSATYLYDNLNRKISETVNYGNFQLTYGYAYYKNGLKKNIIMPDGTSYEYTYDNSNQLTGISSISYSDYQWNKPKAVKLPGGVSKTYSYDPLMRLQTIAVKNPAQNVLMQYGYTYDKMDNIRTKQTEQGSYGYVYDALYRLTNADNPGVNDEAYTYDNAGNRLTANGITGNWTYNANDEMRSFGNTTFDYDRNGNMTQKSDNSQTFTYIYDVENRLVQVEKKADGSVIAKYYYDPFGRRLWKEVSGIRTYFLYADEGLIGEYDASGAFIRTYAYKPDSIWTTDPVFMKQRSGNYFYHNDHLGTPVQMTDISGNVVWSAKYDSFGKTEIGASAVTNNLRQAGQYFDSETGLYYNYFRYYDPTIGRYIETDPLGFGSGQNSILGSKCSKGYRYDNLYVYVSSNPLNYIDPRGQWKVGIESPCIPFPPPLSLVGYQGSVSRESKPCCDGKNEKTVTTVEACLKLCSIRSGLGSLSVSTSSPDAIKSCPKEGKGGGKIFAECHTSIWKSEVSAEYPDWTPKFNVEYTRGKDITINTNGEINVILLAMPSDNGCSGGGCISYTW